MTATLAPSKLTAQDRCDRCRARAYVRVMMASGGELLFCAHHGRKYDAGLRRVAIDIIDETTLLTDTPAVAPADER